MFGLLLLEIENNKNTNHCKLYLINATIIYQELYISIYTYRYSQNPKADFDCIIQIVRTTLFIVSRS